jgi:hypothetical protein
VKFDATKYGSGWMPGTRSWVIPTAFTLIALQQVRGVGTCNRTALNERIGPGIGTLLDRMYPGGWLIANALARVGVHYLMASTIGTGCSVFSMLTNFLSVWRGRKKTTEAHAPLGGLEESGAT